MGVIGGSTKGAAGLEPFYSFRSRLVDEVVRDLIGPSHPLDDEVITDAPITRYIAGILYPSSSDTISPTDDVDVPDEGPDGDTPDPPVAMANVRYPSSFGLTFSIDTSVADAVHVLGKAARYEPLHASGESSVQTPAARWRRIPILLPEIDLPVAEIEIGKRIDLADGAQLYYRVRIPKPPISIVTVVMVNARPHTVGRLRDAESLFQVGIDVTAPDANSAPFVELPGSIAFGSDDDLRAYSLLYRHAKSYAVGHGCGVRWESNSEAQGATRLTTTFAPDFELELSDSNPEVVSRALSMQFAARQDRREVVDALAELCAGYADWIGSQETEATKLEPKFASIARDLLSACKEALARMRDGVDLLKQDEQTWAAFKLANEAMLRVRARADWLKEGRPTSEPTAGPDHSWRPFQLAFILLCLRGIAEPRHNDRDLADLLWFPTGGGKTEAYLGLIAFTTFLRRLRNPGGGGGVTALMRYTLRLLTIQQFERATLLICTCESLRRVRPELGNVPISIGLWVGEGSTPNTLVDARASLQKIRQGAGVADKNPMQLQSCPWCGTGLDADKYLMGQSPDRLIIACRNEACEFRHELPVNVVDQDIYRVRPSLLVATTDKFASLPWRPETGQIFAIGSGDPPPDLIIQDELHLISGPLGTLAGLYETAIDYLCTREGVRPKVVASTATIRRARQQTKNLFDREVKQFPPNGLDARNSYFAVQAGRAEKGTRLYVGFMAPGTSQTTLLVRTYAAVLQKAAELPAPSAIKDPYWTLVGYFNSLRVLSGARMQVQDDVGDRIGQLAAASGRPARLLENAIVELTSRESSTNIPAHLMNMAVPLPNQATLDVILATNMISVGVDVNRLGLMVVMGQPQGTSEYIQATSRVGRQFPGLVFTLFNGARSRDRSHYESFVTYHSALYRQVESTSVTPFSARARDRALHAVLVALARLTNPPLAANQGARGVDACLDALRELADLILRRVQQIDPVEQQAVRRELDGVIAAWRERAGEVPKLVYSSVEHPETALMVDASSSTLEDDQFRTLRSLRDVDVSTGLWLVKNVGPRQG